MLLLTAAFVAMTTGCIKAYKCDIWSVVSGQRSSISVYPYKEPHVLHSWTCWTEAGSSHAHTQTHHFADTHTHRPLDVFSFNA